MKWTVVWTKEAQNDLADLWVTAVDRGAVTVAGDAVDAQLRCDPFANSESREDPTRIMIESPLAVAYDVSLDDCLVTVWAVWSLS